jgi:hypothetical protein
MVGIGKIEAPIGLDFSLLEIAFALHVVGAIVTQMISKPLS